VVRSSGLSSVSRPGEFGEGGLSPGRRRTLMVECTTGTSKVLMVLTVETAVLDQEVRRSIERTPASLRGLVVDEQERCVSAG